VSKASRKVRRAAVAARKSHTLDLSIFVIGAGLLAPFAMAQDAGPSGDNQKTTKSDDEMTEILVTGIRKALQTAQEIKKEADTVVDSITATDIGAFPDKSVAEALQRVSGVTVTRFAASGDTTHFSAEPSGVVIRGLPQVRSEFNGRDSFNANSSRGLSFGDVSPELMAGVDTYKNQTADMIEGGLAGTVNLRTHLPFDSEGFVAAFSGEIGYGNLAEQAEPSGSLILSNRWDTGIGEFGFMVNAAYSHVVTESQGVQLLRMFNTQNAFYDGTTTTKWIPGGIDIRENTYDRTRTGGSLALQWSSPEDSVLATLQYNRSEYENNWEEYSLSAGLGNAQQPQSLVVTTPFSVPAQGTPAYEFDSNGVFVKGVINDLVANGGWLSNPYDAVLAHPGTPTGSGAPGWICYAWTGQWDASKPAGQDGCPTTRATQLGADTRASRQTNTTADTSLNVKWDVNERVGLNFDVQWIDSTVVNFDNSMNDKTATDLYLDLSGGKPYFEFRAPTGFRWTPGGFADPQNWFHEWSMEHIEDSSGTELAARIDADIHLDAGWADALRIGVRHAERDQDVNWSTYNWGSVQPLWGLQTDVPLFLNQGPWQNTYVAKDLGPNLVGGGVFGGGTFLHPAFDIVSNYNATRALYGHGRANTYVPLADRTSCPVVPGTVFCPVEMLNVTEDSDAAYVMFKFGNDDTKIGPVSVKGNIGVRWVRTDVFSSGGAQFPQFVLPGPPQAGSPSDPKRYTPQADRDFQNFASYTDSAGATNDNILPSLNLRFGLTDSQFMRFAAARAMARADMGQYKYYYNIAEFAVPCNSPNIVRTVPGDCNSEPVSYTPWYSAQVGNPKLKPTTADNFDLTYEWYFSDSGSFSAAVFYKKFNDYVVQASHDQDFTNNGVTRTVNVTGPVNADGAKVKGIEVAYQTFFDKLPAPWNGLGIQANYTYVDNQGVTNGGTNNNVGTGDTGQASTISFTNLPLEGFSPNTYNLVLMFDKPKFSARLAYNWRDEYLIGQADCCIKLPVWQEAYGQLDGSLHYKPNASWDVFLDAQNLTESETVLKQQVNNDGLLLPRSWFTNDMRFSLGVRYRIE
jgi:iron complex outermembrane recepter protein